MADSKTVAAPLDEAALAQLFTAARSHNAWSDRPIADALIRRLYELAKWGPTATNSNPGRFVFVRTRQGKERLRPHLLPQNADKTMSAPCCVIVAYDMRFFDLLPQLFPGRDYSGVFVDEKLITETAQRNSTLQGAYLMIAARALGLDCGPMSGFKAESLNAEFFPDGVWRANFLCNLGYGLTENLFPRNPRLPFDTAAQEA